MSRPMCLTCYEAGRVNAKCPCQAGDQTDFMNSMQNGAVVWRDECTGENKSVVPTPQYAAQQSNFPYYVIAMAPQPVSGDPELQCQQRKKCAKENKTICYTCDDKRSDCYPADPKCHGNPQWVDSLADFQVGVTNEKWLWFIDGTGFVAKAASVRSGNDGITMISKKFRRRESKNCQIGYLDRFKAFSILNNEFDVPQCGEIYAEICMAGRTFCTDKHPFGDAVLNPNSDLRLAYASFNMFDLSAGLRIAFALTNDSIYAIYEVMPMDGEEGCEEPNNASFAAAYFLGKRDSVNPLRDYARLGLAIDRRKGAKWYINGNLKLNVDRLGYLPDPSKVLYQTPGQTAEINPTCVNIGLGLFTMLDAVYPLHNGNPDLIGKALLKITDFHYQNPIIPSQKIKFVFGKVTEAQKEKLRNFNQGAALKAKELKVENRC